MALLASLLGAKKVPATTEDASFGRCLKHTPCAHLYGITCPNRHCVSRHEKKYLQPEFFIVNQRPPILRCIYCDHEVSPPYIASAEWHEGTLDQKHYHSASSHWATKIKPENLIFFASDKEAQRCGFKPGHYADKHYRTSRTGVES
jgi:hypothetical protein